VASCTPSTGAVGEGSGSTIHVHCTTKISL
jgi:hypothetical protein